MKETADSCELSDEYYCTEGVVCPKCRNYMSIDENDLWHLFNEDTHEVNCTKCDFDFEVSSSVRWSFSIQKIEEEESENE